MSSDTPRTTESAQSWEPTIVGFLCKWCSYAGADLAGTMRMEYPPNVKIIKVPCSGRVNPVFVLKCLMDGADGVLISGCHIGDCHYSEGNYYARRRFVVLRNTLEFLGIDPRRFQMSWVSASEGDKWAKVVRDLVEEIKQAGPNPIAADADKETVRVIQELKDKAKELLKSKAVECVIGYTRAPDGIAATPALFETEAQVDSMVWDAYCVYNLATYSRDFSGKKIAIVAKGCDVKSLIVLFQENQLKRENIVILGVECPGVIGQDIGVAQKCKGCTVSLPPLFDYVFKSADGGAKLPSSATEVDKYDSVRKLEAKSLAQRKEIWEQEFSRCIRCYACRQVCPMCYCPKCVADQTMPAYFSKAATVKGNFSWNVVRAMHLAGRCIDCGECERVCPAGLPLREINKRIEKDCKELFNYVAGASVEQKPFLSSFNKDDPDKGIK